MHQQLKISVIIFLGHYYMELQYQFMNAYCCIILSIKYLGRGHFIFIRRTKSPSFPLPESFCMDRFLVKWAKSLPIIISCKSLRWHESCPNQRYHIQATDQDQYLSFALCFGDLKIKEKCNLLLGGSLTLLHFHWLQTKRLGNKVSNVNQIVLLLRYTFK